MDSVRSWLDGHKTTVFVVGVILFIVANLNEGYQFLTETLPALARGAPLADVGSLWELLRPVLTIVGFAMIGAVLGLQAADRRRRLTLGDAADQENAELDDLNDPIAATQPGSRWLPDPLNWAPSSLTTQDFDDAHRRVLEQAQMELAPDAKVTFRSMRITSRGIQMMFHAESEMADQTFVLLVTEDSVSTVSRVPRRHRSDQATAVRPWAYDDRWGDLVARAWYRFKPGRNLFNQREGSFTLDYVEGAGWRLAYRRESPERFHSLEWRGPRLVERRPVKTRLEFEEEELIVRE